MPNGADLSRATRTILIVDVVESVRLIAHHEQDVIRRWRAYVDEVRATLLPRHGGRLVKSLGDGMLIEFREPRAAVAAALDGLALMQRHSADLPPDRSLELRMGAQTANVYIDDLDVYGAGVNLAARLATLGNPGELIVSSDVRDHLVHEVDARIEDLGDCHLRHIDGPVRAYRVTRTDQAQPVHHHPHHHHRPVELAERPGLAILPFDGSDLADGQAIIGEAIADGVRALLCRSVQTRIVARLSCNAVAARALTVQEIGQLLGASFVLSGRVAGHGDRLVAYAELASCSTGDVHAAGRLPFQRDDVLAQPSEVVAWAAALTAEGIENLQVSRATHTPLPNLDSYSLETGAVALMHRSSEAFGFSRSRELLEHLIDRHRQAATPRAWLAKWHVLRVTRGLAPSTEDHAARALEQTRRALSIDPHNSLCHAIEGFVLCHLRKDLDAACAALDLAIASDPNEPLAWLFRGVTRAFRGEGDAAVDDTEQAMRLSPLDPMRYYFESLAATAALSAGRHERALQLAEHSRRLNRRHSSTWRVIAISQVNLGRLDDAREAVRELRTLEPELTVARYLARLPAGRHDIGRRWAQALAQAGLPG